MIDALDCGDKTAFLEIRERRLERAIAEFIERRAETWLEDTPPLDSFDLDDEGERDDALA